MRSKLLDSVHNISSRMSSIDDPQNEDQILAANLADCIDINHHKATIDNFDQVPMLSVEAKQK